MIRTRSHDDRSREATTTSTPPEPEAADGAGPPSSATEADRGVRRVIVLLGVNLALSVLATVLMVVFRDSLTSYLVAHTPSLRTGQGRAAAREGAQIQIWTRSATILIVSAIYLLIALKLRAGRRWAYRRVVWIAVAGTLGIVYLIAIGQYPVWLRVEQALQGVVLLTLLWSVTRPAVRGRFAKPATR